jgi:hypothetical protein
MGGVAAVVDNGVREVLGSVLHNNGCIRSMPQHKKEDEHLQSDGSPKRAGGR